MKRYVILLLCFFVLLAACGKQEATVVPQETTPVTTRVVAAQKPTQVPPTYTPYPTYTPWPSATPTRTPRPTSTPTTTRTPTLTPTPWVRATATPTPAPTEVPARTSVLPAATPTPAPPPAPAMERLKDRDPGPPFSISVSANRALEDSVYQVTGLVRNDGDETYEAIGVIATFYSDDGFRFGPVDVRCPCTLLAPGESCPFSVEVTVRRPVAFLLHPEGRPTKRESALVALSGVQLLADGLDSMRITGVATNVNAFKVKNPIVSGVLVDASGQMVSLGYAYVVVEDIEAGAGVRFDLRVARAPYVSYQLYAQAERDWQ
jgi:hypothetical protein